MAQTVEQARADLEVAQMALRAAEEAAKAARKQELENTPIRRRFTVFEASLRYRAQQSMYDDTLVWYRLEGEVLNPDEAKEAGHNQDRISTAGYDYLYNTATQKIAMAGSGGTYWIGSGDPWWSDVDRRELETRAHAVAIKQLGELITQLRTMQEIHGEDAPQSIDAGEIVENYRENGGGRGYTDEVVELPYK
jgi:hypothetical protein